MIEATNGQIIKHRQYFRIASTTLDRVVLEEKNIIEMIKGEGREEVTERAVKFGVLQDQLVVSVVFFYLTLESFVNFYAVIRSIDNRKSFEQNLSTKNKWIIYPQLACGKRVDKRHLDKLNSLTKDRNSLIHYKSKTIGDFPDESFQKHTIEIDKVKEYRKAVVAIIKALGEIDKDMPSHVTNFVDSSH